MRLQYRRRRLTYMVAPTVIADDRLSPICLNEGRGALLCVLGIVGTTELVTLEV